MEGSLGAGQVTVTDAKGSNGPPGADQHPAGSSRAAGRDMTGRGMLNAKRPLIECDPLACWVRVEPVK